MSGEVFLLFLGGGNGVDYIYSFNAPPPPPLAFLSISFNFSGFSSKISSDEFLLTLTIFAGIAAVWK